MKEKSHYVMEKKSCSYKKSCNVTREKICVVKRLTIIMLQKKKGFTVVVEKSCYVILGKNLIMEEISPRIGMKKVVMLWEKKNHNVLVEKSRNVKREKSCVAVMGQKSHIVIKEKKS